MQLIIYTNPDGGVSVVFPTSELPIEEVLARDLPPGVSPELIEADALPSDRLFRAAWVQLGKAVVEDLERARTVAHGIRRSRRAAAFAPHDAAIARRLPGLDEAAVEAKRGEIRAWDSRIQDAIDQATSVDDLRAALAVKGPSGSGSSDRKDPAAPAPAGG